MRWQLPEPEVKPCQPVAAPTPPPPKPSAVHLVETADTSAPALRAVIYSRVSTAHQDTRNQSQELREVALRRGWHVVEQIEDAGISGSKGRDRRPGLDRAMTAAEAKKYDVLLVWALDRLGRSLHNLIVTLAELDKAGVRLYIHQQNIDTTTPAGRAMFQMLGVFAEFERGMIRERVMAGLKLAKAAGKRPGPKSLSATDPKRHAQIRDMFRAGEKLGKIARVTKTGYATLYRMKKEFDDEIAAAQRKTA